MRGLSKWDKRFLEMATLVASWSKDPNTKVGAVIVNDFRNIISVGYNGLNCYVEDEETLLASITREEKRNLVIHAELNAIFNAAKNGASVKDTTIYVNYPTCHHCALSVIQSGIREVVFPKTNELHQSWQNSIDRATRLYEEADVKVRMIP